MNGSRMARNQQGHDPRKPRGHTEHDTHEAREHV